MGYAVRVPDTDLTRSPTVPQTRPAAGRRGIAEAAGWQVWAALLIVYVVWGSTYLGILRTVSGVHRGPDTEGSRFIPTLHGGVADER